MKTIKILVVLAIVLLFTSCAPSQHYIDTHLEITKYGFFGGLWHGFISPIAFVISIFCDDVSIYAIYNNGIWYNLGFVLGTGGLAKLYRTIFNTVKDK